MCSHVAGIVSSSKPSPTRVGFGGSCSRDYYGYLAKPKIVLKRISFHSQLPSMNQEVLLMTHACFFPPKTHTSWWSSTVL